MPLLQAKPGLVPDQTDASIVSQDVSDEELLERVRVLDDVSALTLFRRYNRLALLLGGRVLQDEGEGGIVSGAAGSLARDGCSSLDLYWRPL
jgi:RNA polymerase sigma-70 factor, ECF subfamily